MAETEGESPPPADPASAELSPAEPSPAGAAYLPFGAYAVPSALTTARPAWSRAYELPSARRVVSVGLQLALGSSVAIRRASIYIGLLALGAFGPAALLILIGLARLLSDPATAATLNGNNPMAVLLEQPDLGDPLTLIAGVALVGLVLLVAISIDAKAIAIAMLAGAYSERLMSLPEALARARQTFWRLLWSGLLVGAVSSVISLVLAWPFLRPFDSNQGVTFITSMIATLAVTPFAFAATGIVLGDAGAIEALRRSVRLFRAKPRIALVVSLFTLVSAAIQSFAFGGGADLTSRVATFFHVGEGAASLILPGLLVLALIVAFGSLTFTIAAIVAAPQVAAFLGLTFYSGGLDRARTAAGTPARVRWVSIPMTIVMVGLAVVFVLGISTIASFQPRAGGPLVVFFRQVAGERGPAVTELGIPAEIPDPSGDLRGPGAWPGLDIVQADAGWLPDVPAWLVERFGCDKPDVVCSDHGGNDSWFDDGAVIFLQRMAVPPDANPGVGTPEWGPMLGVPGSERASATTNPQFAGSSRVYLTRATPNGLELVLLETGRPFGERPTRARSLWLGAELVTLIPIRELRDLPDTWDVYGGMRTNIADEATMDTLRPDNAAPLLPFNGGPLFVPVPTFPG